MKGGDRDHTRGCLPLPRRAVHPLGRPLSDRGHGPSGRASRHRRRHLLHLPQSALAAYNPSGAPTRAPFIWGDDSYADQQGRLYRQGRRRATLRQHDCQGARQRRRRIRYGRRPFRASRKRRPYGQRRALCAQIRPRQRGNARRSGHSYSQDDWTRCGTQDYGARRGTQHAHRLTMQRHHERAKDCRALWLGAYRSWYLPGHGRCVPQRRAHLYQHWRNPLWRGSGHRARNRHRHR